MIGNDILPGIITDVESLPAVTTTGLSSANVILVGQGSVADAEAEPNEPYTVTRGSQVREWFGNDNPISNAVVDALQEGALPVYAVMTDENTVEEDNISTSSGTLESAPISEDPEDFEVSGDFSGFETVFVWDSPSEYEVGEDEIYVNPVTGEYEVETTPVEGSVTYTSFDYQSALQNLEEETPDEIDYIYVLNENKDVVDAVQGTVNQLESYKNLVGAGVGVRALADDVTDLVAEYDSKRMQVFYPSRNVDGDTILGAIGGKKASLGISATTMNKRLSTHDRLIDRIDESDQIHLVGETIVPVASESRGALLVDDPTMVSDENEADASMRDGYSRLISDRVTDIVHRIERPYIGKLNKPATRGSLQAAIDTGLEFLADQDAVQDYSVAVYERDAMSATVDVGVETTKPLRNIYNTISVGEQ